MPSATAMRWLPTMLALRTRVCTHTHTHTHTVESIVLLGYCFYFDSKAVSVVGHVSDPDFDASVLNSLHADVIQEREKAMDDSSSQDAPLRVQRLRKVFRPKVHYTLYTMHYTMHYALCTIQVLPTAVFSPKQPSFTHSCTMTWQRLIEM